MTVESASSQRERHALTSALLLRGAAETVDFLLPLYAGSAMGASPTQIGILLAVELAVSLVARPVAGGLADRWDRRVLAGLGAGLYGAACAGYAAAPSLGWACAAAALGGLGGAAAWVSLRAMVGERIEEESSVFARLTAAEETGGWLVFVPALLLLPQLDYTGVLWGLSGCCLVAAVSLASAPHRAATRDSEHPEGSGAVPSGAPAGRRLLPMLCAVLVVAATEGALSLLLLLHLQDHHRLAPLQIALVFLPGAVVMGAVPPVLHRLVTRWGRSRMLRAATLGSAAFAVGLSAAPTPLALAVMWILSGLAWSVVNPVQQAVVAEVSGQRELGRGMGWYEAAVLLGSLVGVVAGGIVYDLGTWELACLACAGVLTLASVLVPASVRAVGAAERPAGPTSTAPAAAPAPPPRPAEVLASLGSHTAVLAAVALAAPYVVPEVTLSGLLDVDLPPAAGRPAGDYLEWVRSELLQGPVELLALRAWVVFWGIHLLEAGWLLAGAAVRRSTLPR